MWLPYAKAHFLNGSSNAFVWSQGLTDRTAHSYRPDEELKIVLSSAPTKYNCMKYARIFKRGYGSIEQIYRWAATTDKMIQEKRPNDAFVKRIKKVAKELGLRV